MPNGPSISVNSSFFTPWEIRIVVGQHNLKERGSRILTEVMSIIPICRVPREQSTMRIRAETDLPLRTAEAIIHTSTIRPPRCISRIFNEINLPWASAHTLRHTFASHLIMAGVEMWTVSKILGHSSISVTEKHYAHLAPKHAEEAMAKLPY